MRTSRIIRLFTVLVIVMVALTFNSCDEKEPPPNVGANPCPPTITDSRDFKVYPTVQIGSQCWLKKNMNYQTGNSWCYDSNFTACDAYGRLYDWETALGVCPSGWHLPSDEEWLVLTDFLGGDPVAGGKMKEAGYWHWSKPNTGATNSSGFYALPGGARRTDGGFSYLGTHAYFWSSSQYDATYAWYRYLYFSNDDVGRINVFKTVGMSVRCVQD